MFSVFLSVWSEAWCGFLYEKCGHVSKSIRSNCDIWGGRSDHVVFLCVFSWDYTVRNYFCSSHQRKLLHILRFPPSCCYRAGLLLTCNKNKTWKSLTKWNEYSPPSVQGNKQMKKREAQETVMVVLISQMGTDGCNEQQQELSNSKIKNVPECF